jgi:hypothetical protein
MKSVAIFLVVSAGMFFVGSKGIAQEARPATLRQQPDTASDQDIELMRRDIRGQKKQLVAANLPLTPDEAAKFWPVYEQYTAETIKVNDQRYALVKEYADNYNAMTDERASSYIRRWIAVDQDATKLRLTYIPIFEKVITAKKMAMFFQIDRRLGLMMELQLASVVPLVPAAQ